MYVCISQYSRPQAKRPNYGGSGYYYSSDLVHVSTRSVGVQPAQFSQLGSPGQSAGLVVIGRSESSQLGPPGQPAGLVMIGRSESSQLGPPGQPAGLVMIGRSESSQLGPPGQPAGLVVIGRSESSQPSSASSAYQVSLRVWR